MSEPRLTVRQRTRAALSCVYCRSDVPPGERVTCRDEACGALYHRDCWAEWTYARGARCAIPGCDESAVEDLSRVEGALRILGMWIAPPRPDEPKRLPGCCSCLLFMPGGHIAMFLGMSPMLALHALGVTDAMADSPLLAALVGFPALFLCLGLTVAIGFAGYRLAHRVVRVGRGVQAALATKLLGDAQEAPPDPKSD